MAKKTEQQKRIAKMEKVIAKHMWTAIFDADEDVANNASYELNKKTPRPEHMNDFMEAYANVESRVKKALGVK